MKANIKLIEWLLFESDIPATEINRGTGLAPMTISDLRNKKSDVMKMRLDNAIKLTKFAKQQKEMDKMDYKYELQQLQKDNGINGNLRVDIYENKEELLQVLSENVGDENEVREIYDFMKEELDYLEDEKELYSVDTGNGYPNYYDSAKEAHESI